MQIDIIYIIIFISGFIFGSILSWIFSSKYYKSAWLKNVVMIKNPELWDLAHFVLKDEEETKKIRNTKISHK